MMGIARGIVLIYTKGIHITPVPTVFIRFANDKLFGIPILVLAVAGIAIVAHVLLKHTVFGRAVYATGSNEAAAELSGVRTKFIITSVYVISGVFAAAAGIFLTSMMESAGSYSGMDMELTVITAVVIGGTSLFGGQGNIIGTIQGVILIALTTNAVNLLGVPPAWDTIVTGAVIICAALVDVYRRKYMEHAY